MSMSLRVNGEAMEIRGGSLADLLIQFGIDPTTGGVAVAHNLDVVPAPDWAATALKPGDEIEIIRATQGG